MSKEEEWFRFDKPRDALILLIPASSYPNPPQQAPHAPEHHSPGGERAWRRLRKTLRDVTELCRASSMMKKIKCFCRRMAVTAEWTICVKNLQRESMSIKTQTIQEEIGGYTPV